MKTKFFKTVVIVLLLAILAALVTLIYLHLTSKSEKNNAVQIQQTAPQPENIIPSDSVKIEVEIKHTPPQLLLCGTYDGIFNSQKIVLVIEKHDSLTSEGFFVFNSGNAVETKQTICFRKHKNSLAVESEPFRGNIEGELTYISMKGFFVTANKKCISKNSFNVNLEQRKTDPEIHPSERYLLPIFKEVESDTNLVYGRAKGRWLRSPYIDDPYFQVASKLTQNAFKKERMLDLKLDIYMPKNDTLSHRPLIMLMHAGAFYIGKKDDPVIKFMASTMAKRGYVVASIDYRMGFLLLPHEVERGGFMALQDAHAALRYMAHNAAKFRIDPNHIFVGGMSAGGVTSLHIAFLENDERPKCVRKGITGKDLGLIETSGNSFTETFTIKGVANCWGAIFDTTMIDMDERIPVISFHGTSDNIVPYGHDYPFKYMLGFNKLLVNKVFGSEPVHQRLDHLHIKNKLISFAGYGHEPELDNFRTFNENLTTIDSEMEQFFHEITAPEISLDTQLLQIPRNSKQTGYPIDVKSGTIIQVIPTGGILASGTQNPLSIIWFENQPDYRIKVIASNEKGAWREKEFRFTVE